jgi:AAA15 family ATPase/GTPase
MKISSIELKNFKRFKNTKITEIPQTAKLVVVVGPNGSGKSSLFDGCYEWYKSHTGFGIGSDDNYYKKDKAEAYNPRQNITITFHNANEEIIKNKKCMSFRTAYRNESEFNISSFSKLTAPQENIRFNKFIDNDNTVAQNYQRLIYNSLTSVYAKENDDKTVKALREELIGKVRLSMKNVFDDLILNNIGDPFGDGTFFFEKGTSRSYQYKNLSGGEKSAFDLLLDIFVKLPYYDDTVFFIDEPDSHMHTKLQGKLIKEIFDVIPDNSQLWITTHSLGVIQSARDIDIKKNESVAIIDFSGWDFDSECNVRPVKIDRVMWEKFLSITLDNYAERIAPETIILCEGDLNGVSRKNFDADIYNTIFGKEFPGLSFISGGSCTDLENKNHPGYLLLTNILKSKVRKLLDRDDRSTQQVTDLIKQGFVVLKRRHMESYLFDDEVIKKLATCKKQENKITDALDIKLKAIQSSVSRNNPGDDIKSAAGDIYTGLKKLLSLTQCGNDQESFMRDTLAILITPDMQIYKELKEEIVTPIGEGY